MHIFESSLKNDEAGLLGLRSPVSREEKACRVVY